jgi:cation diffusion facilitator CzcD-associated flavoprotein CzcO
MEQVETLVVGGGQAGLAVSRELGVRGVEHVVLERGRIGQTWRDWWDSFCLVTPNWSVRLPGHHYDGSDPDGFMPRDDVVAYLERYAASVSAPIREGIEVRSLESTDHGRFVARTTAGVYRAEHVVLANGSYQRPHLPAGAADLPADLLRIDVTGYRNADALPDGHVLIVGSGQSGCQLAEELYKAGRDVFLACGRAPWAPRRIGDHDIVWWGAESGFLDLGLETLASPEARLDANILTTGHRGGHDLHLRTLQELGVTLMGRFVGASGSRASFAPDLAATVAWGDERYHRLMDMLRAFASSRSIELPDLAEPPPFDASSVPEELNLAGFGAVIFTGGFRPDYGSWLAWPEAFDSLGFPRQHDGASTVVPNLYFVGVHFLRKRKSSTFYGVGEDAAVVADTISSRRQGISRVRYG